MFLELLEFADDIAVRCCGNFGSSSEFGVEIVMPTDVLYYPGKMIVFADRGKKFAPCRDAFVNVADVCVAMVSDISLFSIAKTIFGTLRDRS